MCKNFLLLALLFLMAGCLHSQDNSLPSEPGFTFKELTVVNRTELIEFAKSHLGIRYQYAGFDPLNGFDCSGFVYFVFKKFNINLPRSSSEYKYLGKALKPENFKVGDILVFYGHADHAQIGHVGIICEADGMKSRFIHSSSGAAYGVTISELGSEVYTRRFYKCIDVIQ